MAEAASQWKNVSSSILHLLLRITVFPSFYTLHL